MPKIIEVDRVSKKYCPDLKASLRYGLKDILSGFLSRSAPGDTLRPKEFWALHDVSFDVGPGECVGLIGRNGAGKSTLIKLMMGRIQLTEGRITTRGRVVGLTAFGLGFNPVLSGRENIYINAAILGMARPETEAVVDDIIAFAGIGDFIDAPVQCYSSGMTARLGYAVAAHINADVLLIDEALSAGDVLFRRKSRNHIKDFLDQGGAAVFVSHDLFSVQFLCDRCIVLEKGKVTFQGAPEDAVVHFVESTGGKKSDVVDEDQQPEPEEREEGPEPEREEEPVPEEEAVDRERLLEDDGKPRDSEGKLRTALRFSRVQVTPVSGEALQTGAPVRIAATYESPIDTPAAWGFVIRTSDMQTQIAMEMTETEDYVQIKRGGGEISCLLPSLTLRTGTYAIQVAITDADTGVPLAMHGFDEPPLRFTVEPPPATTANAVRAAHHNPLVALDVEWK